MITSEHSVTDGDGPHMVADASRLGCQGLPDVMGFKQMDYGRTTIDQFSAVIGSGSTANGAEQMLDRSTCALASRSFHQRRERAVEKRP